MSLNPAAGLEAIGEIRMIMASGRAVLSGLTGFASILGISVFGRNAGIKSFSVNKVQLRFVVIDCGRIKNITKRKGRHPDHRGHAQRATSFHCFSLFHEASGIVIGLTGSDTRVGLTTPGCMSVRAEATGPLYVELCEAGNTERRVRASSGCWLLSPPCLVSISDFTL